MDLTAEEVADIGPLYRLSVEQHQLIAKAGILAADDPVELLEGLLIRKFAKTPQHWWATAQLVRFIELHLPGNQYHVRSGQPITLADSEPEPDGAVTRGQWSDFNARHPSAAEVLLVMEVADSSLIRDRGIKLRSYARAGISTYWIVNLIDRQIEVFTNPDPTANPAPTYQDRSVLTADAAVSFSVQDYRVEMPVVELLSATSH